MLTSTPEEEISRRAAEESLVQDFEITGLYGYRSISLSSAYAATVLIAKNGSGKTTLLGALDAFLKRQFTRLRDLEFLEIRCKLRSLPDNLVLKHEDVLHLLDYSPDNHLALQARRFDLRPDQLFRYAMEVHDFVRHDYSVMSDEPVFQAVQRVIGYRHLEVISYFDKLRMDLINRNENISYLDRVISQAMQSIDVVYLPTYRRIELALDQPTSEEYLGRRSKKPKLKFAGSSLFIGEIQFGLADISERLSELNQELLVKSNQGYREISAKIISDLIDGTFESETITTKYLPEKEELSLFFLRIKEGRRVGPYFDVTVPDIDRIYTGVGISDATSKFLRYFLRKLGAVIDATRDIETRVENFISECNKYLSSKDLSAVPPNAKQIALVAEVDGKQLCLNRKNLKVHVESIPVGRITDLNALSSGEKQMVSLFAKLYLYPNNKIVLIDEPELSLSIEWQRQILVDVLTAPLCEQVIAITHSPFVFDNALEPYARALKVGISDFPSMGQTEAGTFFDE